MPRETVTVKSTLTPRPPRFHNIGDTFVGLWLMTEPIIRQKTNFETRQKEWWDDEKTRPRMEYIYDFLLVSETPHPEYCHYCKKAKKREDEDTGARRLYATDKQHYAIQDAFKACKQDEGQVSNFGPLTLRYDADDDAKKKANKEAPKLWVATYRNATDDEEALCDKFLGLDKMVATVDQAKVSATYESLLTPDEPKRMTLDDMLDLPDLD